MDAITLLKNDHKTVKTLFTRYEKSGDRAYVQKRELVDRIIEELSRHAAIEEQVFYPVARATVAGTDGIVLESMEEHHIVKWVLSELEHLPADDERFDAKVTVLIENVRHHIDEEEHDFFPKVRAELGRTALAELGDALAAARESAPTHPHPRSPATPPGNVVTGVVAAAVDRVEDTISGIAQGGRAAVEDLIGRVLNLKKSPPSPTGSKVARSTARAVRDNAATAERRVSGTTRAARSGAVSVGRAAKAGAKGTVTTATRSARATATTAKRAGTTTRRAASSAARSTARVAKSG